MSLSRFPRSSSSSSMVEIRPQSSSKLRRQNSMRSLAGLVGRGKKKDMDSISYIENSKLDSISCSGESRDQFQEIFSFKRRLSKRMSSIIDFSKKSQLDGRRHSECTLLNEQVKFTICPEVELLENEVSAPTSRIQRKDIPICWQQESQVHQSYRTKVEKLEDLFSRLFQRQYTQHLARIVLSLMNEDDIVNMYQVSNTWRRFVCKELSSTALNRVLSLLEEQS